MNCKCKVPPGHKRPKRPLQSKRHIPKIMFLAATAKPRPEDDFDGKIGFYRICEMATAVKKSKNHSKGDRFEKDCTLNSAGYRKLMAQVFKDAREKMPWTKNIRCQQDGASPHTGHDNVNKLNRIGANIQRGRVGHGTHYVAKITVITQPAQSPDTNINDLCVFPSMSKFFNRKQKFESVNDLDQIAANARSTWAEMPASKLTKAFETKTKVLKSIIKAKGGNDFKLPHGDAMDDFDFGAVYDEWAENEYEDSSSDDDSSDSSDSA